MRYPHDALTVTGSCWVVITQFFWRGWSPTEIPTAEDDILLFLILFFSWLLATATAPKWMNMLLILLDNENIFKKKYSGKRPQTVLQGTSRRDASLDSASFFCENPYRRSFARSPWQVLCRSCWARSLCKAIGYLYKFCIRGLHRSSL